MLQETKTLHEQQLSNSIAKKHYLKALTLALTLGHKMRALSVIESILAIKAPEQNTKKQQQQVKGRNEVGQEKLVGVIRLLSEEQLGKLLLYIRDWNAIGMKARKPNKPSNTKFTLFYL